MKRFSGGQEVRAHSVASDQVSLQISLHDPVRQRLKSQFVVFRNDRLTLYPVEIRYCCPPKLDLMAQMAGLKLLHRWGGWAREEFNASSEKHVSVYEKAR